MRIDEIFAPHLIENVVDLDPQVSRFLFDLDLKANTKTITAKDIKEFSSWLRSDPNRLVRMYHGTSHKHDVIGKGLLPTSTTRRRSMQSGSGYVYLTYDPQRAFSFAKHGYPGSQEEPWVIYAVTVSVRNLRADVDQLRNKRMWGGFTDLGTTLAHSMIYSGGARYKGSISPHQISVYGYFDRQYQRVDPPAK